MTRRLVSLAALWLAAFTMGAAQTPNLAAIGPKIGETAPDFSGADQFGRPHTRASLAGREGLMLVFFRSADW